MVNQKVIRREGFRPSIAQGIKDVIGEPDDQCRELFVDNLQTRIDDINDDAAIVNDLKKDNFTRTHNSSTNRSNF